VEGLRSAQTGQAAFAGSLQIYQWDPTNAFRRTFQTIDGTLSYRLPNGAYFALVPGHLLFLTPILAPLLVPGLWSVLCRRSLVSLCLLIGWPAMVYAFHAGTPWQNFRFTLAYLPPIAILAAVGAERVQRLLRSGPAEARAADPAGGPPGAGPGGARPPGRLLPWVLPAVLVAGLAWMVAGAVGFTRGVIERKDRDLAVVRWVEAEVPADARLLTFGATLMVRHYTRIETLELFVQTTDGLRDLLQDGRPTYLLIDVPGIEAQWQALSPGKGYHWLRDGPGLVEVGARSGYTLFRVETGAR
jgi:hypothetical protein